MSDPEIPQPGEPGAPGLQILNTDPDKAIMVDPKVDPDLADMVENASALTPEGDADPEVTPEQIESVAINAIAWEIFGSDGREVTPSEDGTPSIETTDEETALCRAAAQRVLIHLDVVRHPFSDLKRFQQEQREWSDRNFTPVDPPGHVGALGVSEETGELAGAMIQALSMLHVVEAMGRIDHAQLKGEQSIRLTPAEVKAKKADAVGDILVYLSDFCTMNDLDMGDCLQAVWGEVQQRDWAANPLNAAAVVRGDIPVPQFAGEVVGQRFEPEQRVRSLDSIEFDPPEDAEASELSVKSTYMVGIGTQGTVQRVVSGGAFVVWGEPYPQEPFLVAFKDIEPLDRIEPDRPSVIHYDEGVPTSHDTPPEVDELHQALGTTDQDS